MFWQYILLAVAFGVGRMYSSVGIIVPMICINFALPSTRKLADKGYFVNAAIVRKKYKISVFIWASINLAVFLVGFCFVPTKYFLAFGIGCLACIVLNGGRTGANEANVKEYIASCAPYLRNNNEEELADLAMELMNRR